MKHRTKWLWCLGACLVVDGLQAQQTTSIPQIHRYALLIGVNEYTSPLDKLDYCHNDMRELKEHFAATGFVAANITLMQDQATNSALRPSKANIDRQLALRLQLANEDDVVVVAFSGHGLHMDGKSYLCPSDARLDSIDSLISIDNVYAEMEKCRANQKLLIIDACRNEPIVRGFRSGKLADDLTIELQPPPKGLIVLSSCEPKQFSAEDEKLQHGVFMYYVMQGLRGAADTDVEIGGNNNGRVSLDELYFFSHEKTKSHVAALHQILQRPVLKGEMVGRFDLALVPDAAKRRELDSRLKNVDNQGRPTESIKVRSADHPLLSQADAFFRQGDYENAIRAYTAIVDDSALAVEVRREARKSRGASYLGRGRKTDIDSALIDQLAAGLLGVQMTVRAPSGEIKIVNEVRGKVKRNQTVFVTKASGDWLWVESVDGSEKLQGYLMKAAVLEQRVIVPKPAGNQTDVRDRYEYDDRARSKSSGNGYRPPSIWETREWESPREIRERRANGTLR